MYKTAKLEVLSFEVAPDRIPLVFATSKTSRAHAMATLLADSSAIISPTVIPQMVQHALLAQLLISFFQITFELVKAFPCRTPKFTLASQGIDTLVWRETSGGSHVKIEQIIRAERGLRIILLLVEPPPHTESFIC